MKATFHKIIWWLIDCIFPTAEPLSPQDKRAIDDRRSEAQTDWENRVAALQADEASLPRYLDLCKAALDDERHRHESINSRLTTIIGFSSIAATIAFGTILTGLPQKLGVLSWLIFLLLGYLTLQLGSAIRAGICGLDRRGYDAFPLTDLLPTGGEAQTFYVRRQIQQYHAIFVQHQDQNNAKLTQMAVAYRAIKNFVVGLLVFAILAGTYRFVTPPSDDLVNRLKTDHTLREMLRGPQGQAGQAGPSGAVGPMGPPCAATLPDVNKVTPPNQPKQKSP